MVSLKKNWISRLFSSFKGASRRLRRSRVRSAPEAMESRVLLTPELDHFVTTEHSDLRSAYSEASGWSLNVHEDFQGDIETEDALLYVGNNAVANRPGTSEWAFLGVAAGEPFYIGTQTQEDGRLYLGAASYGVPGNLLSTTNPFTESKQRYNGSSKWGKTSLVGVEHTNPDGTAGTGVFSVWSNGSFGAPTVLMSSYNDGVANPNSAGLDTTDGISSDDAWWLINNGHAHYNFGFSKPGRYEVQVQLSAQFLSGGLIASDVNTLYFSVGSVGRVEFDAASYQVAEDGGSATINVRRVGGSDGKITVIYATSNGTAIAGSDYTAASGTLTFADGETTKQISVPILPDLLTEPTETVTLTLSAPGPSTIVDFLDFYESGLLGAQATATLNILGNQANTAPTISSVDDLSTLEDVPTAAIPFTVNDSPADMATLVVTATSSNQALVPNANVVLGGSGANRTVTITPVANLSGSTTITLTVTDAGGLSATETFLLTVTPVNDTPSISNVGDLSTAEDTATAPIPFTVGDIETASNLLTVTASSSNSTLVPNGNIVLGGSGANRTVTITPAASQSGSSTITLTVTDEGGQSVTDTFVLTVSPVNDAPSISDVSDQSTAEDTATAPIPFTVGDLETAAESLVVTASSSNSTLVPNGNIALGGSGANRTVTITPAANQAGSTTITLTVTDTNGASTSDTFLLTVGSVNDAPSISSISNLNVVAGGSTGAISFTIGDAETAVGDLIVTATSSNQTVVPNGNIVLAGTGADRTVTVTSAANQTGVSTITLTVTDAGGLIATETFDVTASVNAPPTVSDITNRFVQEGQSTGAIPFTIGDAETAVGDLIVTATSSNTTIVPNGNIVLGGSGANRTATITPAAGQYGPTTITLTVTDGNGAQSSDMFVLTVVANHLVPFTMPSYQGPGVGPSGFQSQMADFNGDGKLDLIVAGSGANALGYRQGVGDGSFMPEQLLNAGSGLSAQGIVAVDYDGDNDMDLVAQEYVQSVANTGTITLYRNNGTASFTRVVLASGHPESYRVVAGDLNGDGRTDLVYGKALSTVAYALQQPSGELGAEVALPVTFGSAQGVLLGDMDNDNDLDIVVSNRANGVNAYFSVFSNDGNGVFSATQNTTTGIFPTALQLVDMNGDGRLDVVTGESVVGSRAGYYPQLANGTFGSRVVVLPTNTQLNSIRVADINGDGIPDIAAGAIVGGAFSMVWSPGLGGGAFGNTILIDPNQGNAFSLHVADLDGDNNPDIVTTGTRSETLPSAIRFYINKTGENPMVLVPPAARTRVASDPIDLQVYFGFPITVTGTPRIALDVGGNTAYANYVSGSGTSTLTFRYTVTATDLDLDGVQLASNLIDLNGGTLTDPIGGPGVLEFPNQAFAGVIVNGRGPLVQSITRLDSQSTTAGTVRFNVQFAEAVTGVDLSDFAVRMSAGDLAGAAVTGVAGSGNLYEVTVSTGTGTGTLGLSVLNAASIFDLSGDALAKGYAGGEVYTVRPTAIGTIDTYYVQGHADYSVEYSNGDFSWYLDPDNGLLPENKYQSDEAITYLDSTAIVNRPAGTNYDFIGTAANQPIYLSNSSGSIASVPFVGWGGDNLVANDFADRLTGDPRVSGSTLREYVKVQMVGFRSSSGGDFSLYSVSSGNPTVWFATSDGIGSTDNIWLYRTHFHRNTAFSKPGTYEIDVVMSGYLDGNANNALDATDVYVESGIKTMVFHVDTLGARDDDYVTDGQTALRGSVSLNDNWHAGLGSATYSVDVTTTKGSLSLAPNGSFVYVPSGAFDGSDSFVYRLTNPRGGYTTAEVSITGDPADGFIAGLNHSHADIGVAYEEDAFDLHVHVHGAEEDGEEEHEHSGIEYAPSEIQIQVSAASETIASSDPAFAFTGAAGGSPLYVLPAEEVSELPFLGFATEEIDDGVFAGDSFELRLKAVSGPGEFSIWSTPLGVVTPHLATADGITSTDVLVLSTGAHTHRILGFTQPGYYQITVEAVATLAESGNQVSSGDVTYYFAVAAGQAPIVTLSEPPVTEAEQGETVVIDPTATVSDSDSTNFDGGMLRVDFVAGSQPGDVLAIQNQGTGVDQVSVVNNEVAIGVAEGAPIVIGTVSGGTNDEPLVIELNDNATAARVNLLLRSITFGSVNDTLIDHREVRFVVADGDGLLSDAILREVEVVAPQSGPQFHQRHHIRGRRELQHDHPRHGIRSQ